MNVEIGAEAALFPEKEYISRIFVAVREDFQAHRFFYSDNYSIIYWLILTIYIFSSFQAWGLRSVGGLTSLLKHSCKDDRPEF